MAERAEQRGGGESEGGETEALLHNMSEHATHAREPHEQRTSSQRANVQGASARRAARAVRTSLLHHILNFSFGSRSMLRMEVTVRALQVALALGSLLASVVKNEQCKTDDLIQIFCFLFGCYSAYMVYFSNHRHNVYATGSFVEQCESDRRKSLLDCMFVSLILCGIVFVKGGDTPAACSKGAPLLYTGASILLVSGLLSLLTPLLVCAGICCCMPCLLALLRRANEQTNEENRNGASDEELKHLPVYEFHTSSPHEEQPGAASTSSRRSSSDRDGTVGSFNGRKLASDDAICCICLSTYEDGNRICELPCMHHLHEECVKSWLKICSVCPICKDDVSGQHPQSSDVNV